jgi:hypothetical protein
MTHIYVRNTQIIQSKLLLLVTRSLASCLGRGALTLATLKPRAPLSEALPIPTMCLLGMFDHTVHTYLPLLLLLSLLEHIHMHGQEELFFCVCTNLV